MRNIVFILIFSFLTLGKSDKTNSPYSLPLNTDNAVDIVASIINDVNAGEMSIADSSCSSVSFERSINSLEATVDNLKSYVVLKKSLIDSVSYEKSTCSFIGLGVGADSNKLECISVSTNSLSDPEDQNKLIMSIEYTTANTDRQLIQCPSSNR